jgi:DNA-binding HxlR family transcriptional regulator
MNAERTHPASPLPGLFHHRWAVPALAALGAIGGEAKFVTLQHALGIGRDSLARTLEALVAASLVRRNPGYGHPMRPEYLLSSKGSEIAPFCLQLVEKLERLGISDLAFNKWSLPVVHATATAGGRFNALRAALPGITPRALTQALRDAEEAGLLSRTLVDDHPPRTEYGLTRRGRGLTDLLGKLAAASGR